MVHRPSDARLLLNLLSHEKDYLKHLHSLLDSSHASLASFSAFAVASSPPLSQTILSIAGYFSSADDALRQYKDAVDAWREQLKTLKDFEAEISNIARDRDIFVTRLLKASKNEKPPKDKDRKSTPSRRSSVISQSQRFASSSSLSLSADHSTSTHTASAPLPTSTKLAAAQAELQACEARLGTKERELERARITAIRDGLRIRCNALIQCGRTWVVMGRDASNVLESLQLDGELYIAPHSSVSVPHKVHPLRTENKNSLGHHHLSSDLSSISPSQSASQVNMNVIEPSADNPPVIPNAPNPILGVNGSDIQYADAATSTVSPPQVYRIEERIERPRSTPPGSFPPQRAHSPYGVLRRQASNSLGNIAFMEQNSTGYEYNQIQVPPAHAITDRTVTMPTVQQSDSRPEAARRGSGYWTPVSNEEGQAHPPKLAPECGIPRAAEYVAVPHLSKEDRLIEEGRLKVIENPRYQQTAAPEVPVVETRVMTTVVTTTDGEPQTEGVEVNVRDATEVSGEEELPEGHFVEHFPDAPTTEPQSPKKSSKRSPGPATPQKTGLLGSLKKVFGRNGTTEREEEKAREKQEKARAKEEKAREKEEKKEEKAREREEKREGRMREREEKAKDKQKQKKERERKRQMRVLVPDSSDESAASLDDDSIRRRRSGLESGLVGLGKKEEKWATRTDKNLDELRRANREADAAEGLADGFVVKKNRDLERNLRGGIVGGHAAPVDLRGREDGGGAAGSSVSLGSTGSGVRGRKKLKKGGKAAPTNGGFVFERGARVVRSSSVSGGQPQEGAGVPGLLFPAPPIPPPLALVTPGTEARFREEFGPDTPTKLSPNKREREDARDKGYVSDTTAFAPSARSSGVPAGPTHAPATHPLGAPATERRPSKKKQKTPVTQTDIESGANLGRNISVLTSASTPALGAGLGGRRKSVDVPTTPSRRGSHRRTVSVDYGRAGVPVASPRVSQATPGAGRPQESLMSIVDNVTRANRHAWDTGLMESKVDRTKGMMRSEVGGTFLGPVIPGAGVKAGGSEGTTAGTTGTTGGGNGRVVGVDGIKVNGPPSAAKERKGMREVVRAPPRVDREALMLSLKGTPGSPGRRQSVTTAYTGTGTEVNGIPGKKPLKSALRGSRSPSPSGVLAVDRSKLGHHGSNYATGTGKDELLPLEVLPSLASLPLEEQKIPSPVGPVERVGSSSKNASKRDGDDDAASTSSYETGHEDFESTDEDQRRRERSGFGVPPASRRRENADKRQDPMSPQLAMPSPIRPGLPPSDMTPSHVSHSPESTPQRRKSVRVSLKPTFSPTPPAIEDEEDQAGRAPFVFQENAQAGTRTSIRMGSYRDGAQAPPPAIKVPTEHRAPKSKAKDIWDDDSDDNMEYRVARQRLQRATRDQAVFDKLA